MPVVGVEAQANGLKCLFSEHVTRESRLLQSTEFLALSDLMNWKYKIIHGSIMRNNYTDRENNSVKRFSIEASAIELQGMYEKY